MMAITTGSTARQAERRPAITGAELTLRDCFPDEEHHVTLLAETQQGYANLCRLLAKAHMESPREYPSGIP